MSSSIAGSTVSLSMTTAKAKSGIPLQLCQSIDGLDVVADIEFVAHNFEMVFGGGAFGAEN